MGLCRVLRDSFVSLGRHGQLGRLSASHFGRSDIGSLERCSGTALLKIWCLDVKEFGVLWGMRERDTA